MALRTVLIAILGAAAGLNSVAADTPNLTGNWDVALDIGESKGRVYVLEIKHEGEKIEAVLVSPRTNNRYASRSTALKDNVLTLEIVRRAGDNDVVMKVKAKVDPAKKDVLEGEVGADGVAGGQFVARRSVEAPPKPSASPLAGKWKAVTVLPDGQEREGDVEINEEGGKHTGKTTSRNNTVEFKSVALDGKKAEFHLVLSISGSDTEFVIRAEFEGDATLKGKWSTLDDSISGEWRAKKLVPAPAPAPAPSAAVAPAKLALRYRMTTRRPDGSAHAGDLYFTSVGADPAGHIVVEGGKKTELRALALKGNQVEFAFGLDVDGGPHRVRVTGTVEANGSLKGTWRSADLSGEWSASPVEDL